MARQSLIQLISDSPKFKSTVDKQFAFTALGAIQNFTPQGFKPPVKLVDTEQVFGIEVEIENVTKPIPSSLNNVGWGWTEDGSLRNAGQEFISLPMRGDSAVYSTIKLYEFLNKIGATCSPRTSVHMHVDMQSASIEQLWNTILLYMVFERVLYDFVGNDRDKNNFCIPLYCYPYTFDFITVFAASPAQATHSWLKYTGLNLKPLGTNPSKLGYGTIEFRHFSGSKDYNKVLTWVNIILSLVRTAKTNKFVDLYRTINSSSPQYLTNVVFGDLASLFYQKPLQLLISEGIRDFKLMQHIFSSDGAGLTSTSDLYKATVK